MKLTSRRKVAAVASVAALSAIGASVLAIAPASAGNANRITASTTSIQAAAGTCSIVSFTPIDQYGVTSSQPDTLTVTLTENPESASQDVDFCSTGATTPDEAPSYATGNNAPGPGSSGPTTQTYVAGPGITPTSTGSASGGTPDVANDQSQTNSDPTGTYDNTNPNGIDRARYFYRPANGPIRVGIVGLIPGGATINAFFDDQKGGVPGVNQYTVGDYKPESTETQAPPVSVKFTAGGQPGTPEAAAAVTAIDIQPANGLGAPGSTQTFTATLRNSSGDTVRGVTPLVQVAQSGANPLASPSCTQSDNAGISTCSFVGNNPGSDQLTVYVNKAGGTAGVDANEVSKTTTRTTTKNPVASSEARYIDLSPKSSVTTSGKSATFTATITDVSGAPARLVSVVFTKTGPGSFPGGGSSVAATTNDVGQASVTVSTAATESGTLTLTGTINTPNTQCAQAAGAGNGSTSSTPPGRCTDTAVSSVSGSSPSPSTSSSPSPSSSGTRQNLDIRTSTPDIQPNDSGILDVTGQPNSSVELRCYTRPDANYFTARGPVNITNSGTTQFRILPGANTRCYVRYTGDETTASPSVVINVHTTLSLSAVRQSGVRNYLFQGRNLPRRAGQLITLYRIDNNGNEIRTANLKTDASGIYKVARHFTGTGTFLFRVRTSQTLNNAAGASTTYRLTIR